MGLNLTRYHHPIAALIALVVALSAPAGADRLLEFAARERAEGAVRIAEVTGGGQVLIRLRSKTARVLPRAESAAEALRAAVLSSYAPPAITTAAGADGTSVLKAGSQAIATADKETAQLSSTTPAALATSWQAVLKGVLAEAYLALAEHDGLQAPAEEARHVACGGPLGKVLTAVSGDESVALVKVEVAERRVKVYGVSPGDTTITLKAGRLSLPLSVQVRYWAARIAASAVAELTGSGQDGRIAAKVAANAALASAQPRPGASVSLISTERQGSVFTVGVLATGEGYLDAKRQVEVQLKWVVPPSLDPLDVFVSNSPERISSLGCLMREQLQPNRAARVLYHHVNSSGQPLLFVARIANPTAERASAHVVLAESGPGRDELGVGHAAAVRFWSEQRTGSGYILQVPSMMASDIVRVPVGRDAIVSGLAQIAVLSAAPVFLEVHAVPVYHEAEWVEPLSADAYAAPKLTTFGFGARKVVELKHEIAGPWTFYNLGKDGSTNEAGTYLAGDYGVLHQISLEIANPHGSAGWAEVEVRAGGGVMRGLFAIDGVVHETGLLVGTQQEQLLKVEIPAGATRRVRIETIPESASNYPVQLTVHSQLRDQP